MVSSKEATAVTESGQLCDYELVFIIKPEVADEAIESIINNISQFITNRGGTVASIDRWGKKRLAYPIKRFLEGYYVLAKFKINRAASKELESNLRLSEDIIRHLLINPGG